MTSKPHTKHEKIARPVLGEFGRNEWAFVGTTCEIIESLTNKIIRDLGNNVKCAYVDASHHPQQDDDLSAAWIRYTDHQTCRQVNYLQNQGAQGRKLLFNGCGLILVNGNHFQAARQVICIDPRKEQSLRKRIKEITDPQLILLADGVSEIYPFLKEHYPGWQNIPVLKMDDEKSISEFFLKQVKLSIPEIKGLVLAGGRSQRMGQDKTIMNWHGTPQRSYLYETLGQFCTDVYISCREDQMEEFDTKYRTMPDTFTGLGPYGAILSAFRTDPDAAWLVVASDLPFLSALTLQHLVQNRNASACATTYQSPFDRLPEPLVTLWEPQSYLALLSFLSLGITCPRKVLIQNEAQILLPPDEKELTNVNTPEEFEKARALINTENTRPHGT